MPGYSGALKKFRENGYSKDESPKEDDAKESSGRTIKLTDDERQELSPYAEKFGGDEIVIEVTGRLEDHGFRISSLKYAQGGKEEGPSDADAAELMAKMRGGPVMQSQTIPSPS